VASAAPRRARAERLGVVSGGKTRAEHVEWTKTRALLELDAGGPDAIRNAIASVQSDLGKHSATEEHSAILLMGVLAFGGELRTEHEVREFIEGIN
jgi:hypothetical protein